jgi:hypothetical protein
MRRVASTDFFGLTHELLLSFTPEVDFGDKEFRVSFV